MSYVEKLVYELCEEMGVDVSDVSCVMDVISEDVAISEVYGVTLELEDYRNIIKNNLAIR